ncbi:MAG: hypothetical protein ACLSVD_13500 [Eggerthellaceae bacterium]
MSTAILDNNPDSPPPGARPDHLDRAQMLAYLGRGSGSRPARQNHHVVHAGQRTGRHGRIRRSSAASKRLRHERALGEGPLRWRQTKRQVVHASVAARRAGDEHRGRPPHHYRDLDEIYEVRLFIGSVPDDGSVVVAYGENRRSCAWLTQKRLFTYGFSGCDVRIASYEPNGVGGDFRSNCPTEAS